MNKLLAAFIFLLSCSEPPEFESAGTASTLDVEQDVPQLLLVSPDVVVNEVTTRVTVLADKDTDLRGARFIPYNGRTLPPHWGQVHDVYYRGSRSATLDVFVGLVGSPYDLLVDLKNGRRIVYARAIYVYQPAPSPACCK